MKVAILLDGDFTRRLVERKLGRSPSIGEIEAFCRSILIPQETLLKIYYYDCPPFSEQRIQPVSRSIKDFSISHVHQQATVFQNDLKQNPSFLYRRGHLSFDGWTLQQPSIQGLIKAPRPLTDADFEPVLRQKQVDMKIGFDVAKLSIKQSVGRILLATSDSDFIPAIDFAKTYRIEVVLLSDVFSVRKKREGY
ncbi:MAG: hypothetical protein ABSA44_14285 [Bacteroidota bacterium]|jgi:uncharacterized LabA/DUF88 family protein